MICSNCRTDNEAGRRFCEECGARLAATCPSCGAANKPTAKFCGECGTALADMPPGVVPAQDEAATDESAQSAERRRVSILFVDLVGFTSRADGADPEDVREFLERYFERASAAVARYGGTLEKFIGDAVMAVWGVPVAHEDDAERAVRAGLEVLDVVAQVIAPDGGPTEARAAVMTGEVAVTIGAEGHRLVAGDLVNAAARLQAAASSGSLLVDEATRRVTSSAIAYEGAGDRDLRGKALPVSSWRALRVVARRGGGGRAERLETPFVGRRAELALLKDLFHSCADESRARLVSVVGIAGIGKSRLIWELEKYLDGIVESVAWHLGRSPAYGEGVTFWALGEMVRRRARIAEDDDPSTTRQKLLAALREHIADDGERSWMEPRLATLLAIEEAPPGEREELYAAWRRLFERIAERQPTVLVFEDLQWADPALLDFIETMLEWSRNYPILIVTLARPEIHDRRPGWGAGQRLFTGIHLEPLAQEETRALLAGLVPGLDTDLVARIVERAEGIPLYAVETVRMLVDEGHLVPTGAEYELARPVERLDVPPTLHALVASRLDALEPDDRALLQDAAVLGQTFTLAALEGVTGLAHAELAPRLRSLARRELLALNVDPRSPERGQYGFVQALIREVVYGTLTRRDRRAKHLAAARYFEALGDDELAGILASHYLQAYRTAGEGPEAQALAGQTRLALRGAAERAAALHAYEQAISYLDQALEVTAPSPERAELLERLGAVAQSAALYPAAERALTAAIEWHQEQRDATAVARTTAALGSVLLLNQRVTEAIPKLEEALAELGDLRDDIEVARLTAELARGYMFNDEFERAIQIADRALEAAGRLNAVSVVVEASITRAACLGGLRRRHEMQLVTLGAQSMAELHGLHRSALRAMLNSWSETISDSPRAGLETAEAGRRLARELGQRDWFQLFSVRTAISKMFIGELDAARAITEELLAQDLILERAPGEQFLALVDAMQGDVEAATDHEARARELSAEIRRPETRLGMHLQQSLLDFALGRFEDSFREASELVAWGHGWLDDGAALAGRAALFMRDAPRLRSVLESWQGRIGPGRVFLADSIALNAGLASLEGRPTEAIAGFVEATRRWRELGVAWDLGIYLLAFVELIEPNDPNARAAADEAREIFLRLRARLMLERLDTALRRSGEARAVEASATVEPVAADHASLG